MYEVTLLLSLLLFLIVCVWYTRSPYLSVYHPFALYAVFHGFLFVFRPILGYFLEYSDIYKLYQFTPSLSDKITAILVANVGFLSFAFFCFRHGAIAMKIKYDEVNVHERVKFAPSYVWVAAICLPIGF